MLPTTKIMGPLGSFLGPASKANRTYKTEVILANYAQKQQELIELRVAYNTFAKIVRKRLDDAEKALKAAEAANPTLTTETAKLFGYDKMAKKLDTDLSKAQKAGDAKKEDAVTKKTGKAAEEYAKCVKAANKSFGTLLDGLGDARGALFHVKDLADKFKMPKGAQFKF